MASVGFSCSGASLSLARSPSLTCRVASGWPSMRPASSPAWPATSWGSGCNDSGSRLSVGPSRLLIAGAILGYGNHSEHEITAQWALCVLIGVTAPFFAELQLPAMRKACALIARYSYGIYLTHLHAQWTAFVLLKDSPSAVRYSVLVVLSVGLPVALYHFIEAPMVRMGARLAQRLPRTSAQSSKPTPAERPLPITPSAAPHPTQHAAARPRAAHAPDHRHSQTAPAPCLRKLIGCLAAERFGASTV
jgi:hypothetical protein